MESSPFLYYREIAPSPALSTHVSGFWEFRVESSCNFPYEHFVPPDGCTSLIVRYSTDSPEPMILLFGPRVEPFQVSINQPDVYFGCRFKPHTASTFLNLPANELVGVSEPIQFKAPKLHLKLMEAIPTKVSNVQSETTRIVTALDTALVDLIDPAKPIDELISNAVDLIQQANNNQSIQEIADQLQISVRQLQRRFADATGLTPKQFFRIRRLRLAAAELLTESPRPWINVAYEKGFSDQSHLTREFSQLIGLTAEEFRKHHEMIQHHDVDP